MGQQADASLMMWAQCATGNVTSHCASYDWGFPSRPGPNFSGFFKFVTTRNLWLWFFNKINELIVFLSWSYWTWIHVPCNDDSNVESRKNMGWGVAWPPGSLAESPVWFSLVQNYKKQAEKAFHALRAFQRDYCLESLKGLWNSNRDSTRGLGQRFAAALLPRLFGTNPRSHH